MSSIRSKLRAALTRRLVPELRQRGFMGEDAIRGTALVYEYVRSKPDQLERLTLQFDKRLRPRFIVNLQIDPPGGWSDYRRHGGLLIHGRLAPGGGIGTASWFRADYSLLRRLLGAPASCEDAVVDAVLARLDRIEAWFRAPAQVSEVYTTRTVIEPQRPRL